MITLIAVIIICCAFSASVRTYCIELFQLSAKLLTCFLWVGLFAGVIALLLNIIPVCDAIGDHLPDLVKALLMVFFLVGVGVVYRWMWKSYKSVK